MAQIKGDRIGRGKAFALSEGTALSTAGAALPDWGDEDRVVLLKNAGEAAATVTVAAGDEKIFGSRALSVSIAAGKEAALVLESGPHRRAGGILLKGPAGVTARVLLLG